MDKKTTGIGSYITLIGWLIAFCAGDKELPLLGSIKILN